jgi:hypothetical protein
MNKDIQDRWVLALRSGRYQQGAYSLNRENRFCCFGVLCELYMDEHPEEREHMSENSGRVGYYGNYDLPQSPILYWAEISTEFGDLPGMPNEGDTSKAPYLTNLNDEAGLTFDQIADLIERFGDSL